MLEIRRSSESHAGELSRARAASKEVLNAALNQARAKLVTDLIGQEMIYLAKEKEATKYLALSSEPETLVDFPFIAAEVGVTGSTALEVAMIYGGLADIWVAYGAALEGLRKRFDNSVEVATSHAEIQTCLDLALAQLAAG